MEEIIEHVSDEEADWSAAVEVLESQLKGILDELQQTSPSKTIDQILCNGLITILLWYQSSVDNLEQEETKEQLAMLQKMADAADKLVMDYQRVIAISILARLFDIFVEEYELRDRVLKKWKEIINTTEAQQLRHTLKQRYAIVFQSMKIDRDENKIMIPYLVQPLCH